MTFEQLDCQVTGFDDTRDYGKTIPCSFSEIKLLIREMLMEFSWIVITVGDEIWVDSSSGYAMDFFKIRTELEVQYG